jgi:hypothetical protein
MAMLGRTYIRGVDYRLESQQSSVADEGGAAPDCSSSSSSSGSSSSSSSSSSVDCRGLGNEGGNPSHIVVAMSTSCHEGYFTYESLRAAARESAQGEDASLPAVCA